MKRFRILCIIGFIYCIVSICLLTSGCHNPAIQDLFDPGNNGMQVFDLRKVIDEVDIYENLSDNEKDQISDILKDMDDLDQIKIHIKELIIIYEAADGKDGQTPFIGTNNNWWIGETDTGVSAIGVNGIPGLPGQNGKDGKPGSNGLTPSIGPNGNWFIGTTDTGISALGQNGLNGADGKDGTNGQNGSNGIDGLTPSIGLNGNWFLGVIDTGIKAQGENGNDGSNGITPHIGSNGNWYLGSLDTGIKASGADGLNGQDGSDGSDGVTPHIGINGNWWLGTTDTGFYAGPPNNGPYTVNFIWPRSASVLQTVRTIIVPHGGYIAAEDYVPHTVATFDRWDFNIHIPIIRDTDIMAIKKEEVVIKPLPDPYLITYELNDWADKIMLCGDLMLSPKLVIGLADGPYVLEKTGSKPTAPTKVKCVDLTTRTHSIELISDCYRFPGNLIGIGGSFIQSMPAAFKGWLNTNNSNFDFDVIPTIAVNKTLQAYWSGSGNFSVISPPDWQGYIIDSDWYDKYGKVVDEYAGTAWRSRINL